jgi:histidinol dehydrogenase
MRIKELSTACVSSEVAALRVPESANREIAATVAALIADVRLRGDAAVVEATVRFDWEGASSSGLVVAVDELEAAYRRVDARVLAALETARDNCTFFHEHELRPDWEDEGAQGQRLGMRYRPVRRAGLYVPGGLGSYASTVIMNAVPAQVAGVKELVICTPPGRDGAVNPSVLAAARLLGIEQVFRAGGAQAIAALAYGTETIPRVDVVCGPGNVYVTEAKRQVYGAVGIDSLAGPSEVLVVADEKARPDWIAADMLAQEEHGSGAQAVLVAESERLCREVDEALERLRASAQAGGPAPTRTGREGDGLRAFYPAAEEDFLDLAARFINSYAPEHLEVQLADPGALLAGVRSAGAVFVGDLTATAFGDYVAGTNHVLPTGGTARFASPLSVDTFMCRSSLVEMTPEAVTTLSPHLAELADSEGFSFHRLSAELRAADTH